MLEIKDISPRKEPLRVSLDRLELGTLFLFEGRPGNVYMKIQDIRVCDWNGTIFNAVEMKEFHVASFLPTTYVTPIHDTQLVINSGGLL